MSNRRFSTLMRIRHRGPDGYSSGFFKAAWPIVGHEVSSAVLDFFNTGRLLKQINTTLLALIPKELFTGYNQARLPPRCALKVDIRKAYDMVEWDFMIAAMELFGFPSPFVKWIEVCVTTPSFSVGLNGKPHGFFKGARGLRQGDPLSPYLFVLVMEEVLHLGFPTVDMNSIGIFKTGLDRFAEWLGLRLNVQKSHLIISRSAQGLREEMLATLGFSRGSLTDEGANYKICTHVAIGHRHSSCQRKLQMKLKRGLRTFLWKGTTTTGYAKEGLGFKDIPILNRALMMKKLCDIIMCDRTSIWVEWLYRGRLRDTSIWTIREHGGSWSWRKILRLQVFLRPMVDYQIRDGRRFYLWQDPWHYLGPLSDTFPRGPRLLGIEESAKLSTVISGGEWQWPLITDFECLEITHSLPTIHGGEDHIIWRFEQGNVSLRGPRVPKWFIPRQAKGFAIIDIKHVC
ncbi:UNVERIFIED_CONTAM: Retrovirus-related Pol polyprotein from type-1 retrotransposable element R2 [Sesamum indicum]